MSTGDASGRAGMAGSSAGLSAGRAGLSASDAGAHHERHGHRVIKLNGVHTPLMPHRPREPHSRSLRIAGRAGGPVLAVPRAASLRDKCPPIVDQRPLQSCTAHAATSALRFLHMRDGSDEELSRLFCYWVSRVMVEGKDPAADAGCVMEHVMKAVETYGVCLENAWPYDVARLAERPPAVAFDDAAKRKVLKVLPLPTLRAIKQSIAEGFPAALLFTVAKSVEDGEDGRASRTWETGVFPLPADDDPEIMKRVDNGVPPPAGEPDHGVGSHAVVAVAYDDDARRVTIMNSWSNSFGDNGFGYLGYEFFGPTEDSDLQSHTAPCMAYDAYTLRAQGDEPSA